MTKAKNSERKNAAPEVSDEVAESIAAQADELGPEGGIIAVPEGASDDQVEQVLEQTGAEIPQAPQVEEPKALVAEPANLDLNDAKTQEAIAYVESRGYSPEAAMKIVETESVEVILKDKSRGPLVHVEILSPVRCDGRVYVIGDEAGFPKAIAERLIECGSAKRID